MPAEVDGRAARRDSNGDPLFAVADARVMRFDSDVSFAPVPAAGDVFVVNGNSLSTSLPDTADALTAGDQAALGAARDTLAGPHGHFAHRPATSGLSATARQTLESSRSEAGL